MSQKRAILLIFSLMFLWQTPAAWSDDTDREEQVFAVQNRIFHRDHEIDLSLGYIADDDFNHVYPISVGYLYHFNEHFSWEVGRFSYLFNEAKKLRRDLQDDFGVQPERFPEQQYMFHTHLVFKPLYGKSAVLNRKVVNHEVYVFAGAGLVHYEWEYSTGEKEGEDAYSISLGVGMKYFLNQRYCLNFELRDLVNIRENETAKQPLFCRRSGVSLQYGPPQSRGRSHGPKNENHSGCRIK